MMDKGFTVRSGIYGDYTTSGVHSRRGVFTFASVFGTINIGDDPD